VVICMGQSANDLHVPSSLASLKSRMVLPFWYQLTQDVLEKSLLNGSSSRIHGTKGCSHVN